jgi:hypothetical protein
MGTVALALLLDLPSSLQAHEEDWRAGARLNIWTAFGVPANDIIGGSLYASRNLEDVIDGDWWATAEIYAGAFDFENPGDEVLGTSGTPTADAKIAMRSLTLSIEWHPLARDSIVDVYVGAGFGVVFLGDGDAKAPGTVDVDVDGHPGVELHLNVGVAFRVFRSVYATADLRVMEVVAKMDVEDRISGRSDSLDNWEAAGFSLGLELRF